MDVGLDLAHMAQNKTNHIGDGDGDGGGRKPRWLGDWHVIEKEIDHIPFGQRVLPVLGEWFTKQMRRRRGREPHGGTRTEG